MSEDLGKAIGYVELDASNFSKSMTGVMGQLMNLAKVSSELGSQLSSDLNDPNAFNFDKTLNNLEELNKAFKASGESLENIGKDLESTGDSLDAGVKVLNRFSQKAQDALEDSADYAEKFGNKSQKAFKQGGEGAKNLGEELEKIPEQTNEAVKAIDSLELAVGNIISEGVQELTGALGDLTSEVIGYSKTLKNLQAQTGATNEEIDAFKSVMLDLFKDNYGESLEDIGDKMSYIKQVTKETDPTQLGKLTENALALESVFGSDFNESIRGIDSLMTHFGLTATEAFDLYAKGLQRGLNYTDELGDNIAEYSGNFAQAGYSAEEYFQLLENGAEGGAYNLDKVNDSINEIKNRLGDGSIQKNLSVFSTETQKAFLAWERGDASIKSVIDTIVEDIGRTKNEQEALNKASIAFGTMGEDANLKVINSLTTLGGSYKEVSGTLEEIKNVSMDNAKDELDSLSRTIKVDIIEPVIDKALPHMKEGVEDVKDNIDILIPTVAILGTTTATAFSIVQIANFKAAILSLIPTLKTVGAAATTFLLSPLGQIVVIATAVTALASGYAELAYQEELARAKTYELNSEQQALLDSTEELKDSYASLSLARERSIGNVEAEYAYYEGLKEELQSITDANGQVKEGYEDRANFILTTLAEQTGVETQLIGGVIDKYGELINTLDTVMQKQRAQAYLSAQEEAYTKAIQKRNEVEQQYLEYQRLWSEAQSEVEDAKNKWSQNQTEENRLAYERAQVTANAYKHVALDTQQVYYGMLNDIANYENLSSSIILGDVEEMEAAILNIKYNIQHAGTTSQELLISQHSLLSQQLERAEQALADGVAGVTQETVDELKKVVKLAENEMLGSSDTALEANQNTQRALVNSAEETVERVLSQYKKADASLIFEQYLNNLRESQSEQLKVVRKSQQQETEVIRTEQEKQRKAIEDTHEKELKSLESKHNKTLKMYEKEYNAKLQTLDEEERLALLELNNQLEALDAEEEAEEKAERLQERIKRRQELLNQINYADTFEDYTNAVKELEEYDAQIAKEDRQEERNLRREEIEKNKEAIQEESDEKRSKLEEEYDYRVEVEKTMQQGRLDNENEQYELRVENLEKAQEKELRALEERHESVLEYLSEEHEAQLEYIDNEKEAIVQSIESLNLYQMGETTSQQFAEGLTGQLGGITSAGEQMGEAILEGIKTFVEDEGYLLGEDIANSIKEGVDEGLKDLELPEFSLGWNEEDIPPGGFPPRPENRTGETSGTSISGNTFNFFSPEALDPYIARQQFEEEMQNLVSGY